VKKKILTALQIVVTVVLLAVVLRQVNFSDNVYTEGSVLGVENRLVRIALPDGSEKTFPQKNVEIAGGGNPVEGAEVEKATQDGLLTIIKGIKLTVAVPFALLSGMVILLTSIRLYLLLKVQKMEVTLWETIRYSFIGIFFNWVLPGLVTGDVVKLYFLGKKTGRFAMTGLIIVLDRVLGAFMLFSIGSVMSLFIDMEAISGADMAIMKNLVKVVWFMRFATICGLIGGFVFFNRKLYGLLRIEKLYGKIPGGRFLEKLHNAMLLYHDHPAMLVVTFFLCAGVHFTTIACNFGLGRSLGIEGVTFQQYSVFMPIVFAAVGVIPLSVGGLGLRESMYVLTLKSVNVAAEKALNLSLLFWVICVLWSVPGAFFYMTMRERVSTEQMQKELAQSEEEDDEQ